MGPLGWIAVSLAAWTVLIALIRWFVIPALRRGPAGDPVLGLAWYALKVFGRIVHRVRFTGLEHLPTRHPPRPLVVVSNHTGSVDPLLISSACPFLIRWMMGDDMMWDRMAPLWDRLQLIPVDRTGDRPVAIREALRTLRNKGAVGIFPEGRITLPRGEIRPFFDGVGALISRARADTLLVWVEGTPETDRVGPSLFTPSRSTVHFIELIAWDGERDPGVITARLRNRLLAVSGWTANDEALPLVLPERLPF
ncbi:MAG: hypothetical protein CMJ41_03885 [Phycisphaerae bacterium]|nr:hypothetical protein [Phycisphaerae bacterium]